MNTATEDAQIPHCEPPPKTSDNYVEWNAVATDMWNNNNKTKKTNNFIILPNGK